MSHYVLGFSGGADSVYLFHHFIATKQEFRCFHVNHKMNIHDDEAEKFCRDLCMAHKIGIKVFDVVKPLKNETEAREARYQAFKEDVKPNECLVLAHHIDDSVETMLMNLCKGTSLNGMSGIPARSRVYDMYVYRPLIEMGLTKETLKKSLTYDGMSWYEDPTNSSNDILRNKLRNIIIPQLVEMFPNCVEKIAEFGDDCSFAVPIVEQEVRNKIGNKLSVHQKYNNTAHQRFWFFNWVRSHNIMCSKRHYREFVAFIVNDNYKAMCLPNGYEIVKSKSTRDYSDQLYLFIWKKDEVAKS